MTHAVIYDKPGCSKCKLTEQLLSESMRTKVEHLFIGNDEWSDRKLEKFRDQGYSSMPVVRIYSGDGDRQRVDDWCDFRPDRINKWKE